MVLFFSGFFSVSTYLSWDIRLLLQGFISLMDNVFSFS